MSNDKTVRPLQWPGSAAPPAGHPITERTVIEQAAEVLRSLLVHADGEVSADHQRRQLNTSAGSIVIGLEHLFEQLAVAPTPQWSKRIETFVATAVAGQQTIQKLRLHDWETVADRLMVRVIPSRSAGSMGRPIGHGLTLAPGIDLGQAIAIPTATHVASWNQPTETLINTARDNGRRTLLPTIRSTELEVAGVALKLTVLLSSPWATGAIIDLGHFVPPPGAAQPSKWPEHRRLVSVLGPTTLAVLESASASRTLDRSDTAVRSAVEKIVSGWFGRALPTTPSAPPDLPSYNLFEIHDDGKIEAEHPAGYTARYWAKYPGRIEPIYPRVDPDGD